MGKAILFTLVVMLLLLVGCSSKTAETTQATTQQQTQTAAQEQSPIQNVNTMDADIQKFTDQAVSELKNGGMNFLVYPAQSTANADKEGFFVIAIRNNLPGDQKYRVTLKQLRAHTVGGMANSLQMDATALSWFRNPEALSSITIKSPGTGRFELGNGIEVAVLKYTVGENSAADSKTQKGNYIYTATLESMTDTKWQNWDEVANGFKQISIKYA